MNKNMPDIRVIEIRNRIIDINKSIKKLENQIYTIIKDSYDIYDEKITNNNLEITYSLIFHYRGQKFFLINKLGEYYSIMSNQNIVEQSEFLEIWREQTDLLLNRNNSFSFISDSEKNIGFTHFEENTQKKLIKI